MIALAVFLALVVCAALAGAQFMPGPWYAGLAKPAWTPPAWVFGPAWTVLYAMIAVAGWRVWRVTPRPRLALGLWAAQLVLNALWTPLFFGLHRPGPAFAAIVLLWAAIAAFALAAVRRDRAAAALFVPYALWVGFAAALNFAIWRMNPG
jgi:benzodiazapine receptor